MVFYFFGKKNNKTWSGLKDPFFMGKFGTHGQEIHLAATYCDGLNPIDTHRPNPRKEGMLILHIV